MIAITVLIVVVVLQVADYFLYAKTVNRFGPQWNWWPLSGFWVAWKHRKGPKP